MCASLAEVSGRPLHLLSFNQPRESVAEVSAELYQVPAGTLGFDAGPGYQHRFSSSRGFVLMHAPSTVEAELWTGASRAICRGFATKRV